MRYALQVRKGIRELEFKESTTFFHLVGQYQMHMEDLIESVRQSDKGNAMDRVTMLLITAQNILKLAVLENQENCLDYANVLLQSTAQLSVSLGNVWGSNMIDQDKAWKQIIPVLERMRQAPGYN